MSVDLHPCDSRLSRAASRVISPAPCNIRTSPSRTRKLLFAPVGRTYAIGATVTAGVRLVFDAVIGGKSVHVEGSNGVSPNRHLTAHLSVLQFGIGSVGLLASSATVATDQSLLVADHCVEGRSRQIPQQ